jgi:hypothetical protein
VLFPIPNPTGDLTEVDMYLVTTTLTLEVVGLRIKGEVVHTLRSDNFDSGLVVVDAEAILLIAPDVDVSPNTSRLVVLVYAFEFNLVHDASSVRR